MTDPTGRSFLSYRRTRKRDAELLIAAQHDVGIPTWQDIANLDESHTEEELRRVLSEPDIANAILWLTLDVADSPVINQVEAPLILKRAQSREGFFVVPVIAGNLDYSDAARVLDYRFTATELEAWNLHRIEADSISPSDAAFVAKRVLNRRLAAIHKSLREGASLRLNLYTRTPPPFQLGTALLLDWTGRFNGREASSHDWNEFLLPALKTVAEAIQTKAPGRTVEASGLLSIPAAFALGCAFLSLRRLKIAWSQSTVGRDDQLWDIEVPREPSGFEAQTIGSKVDATDLAVLVSVTAPVEHAFAASQSDLPPFRAIAHVSKSGGNQHDLTTPEQAKDVAYIIMESIREARSKFRQLWRIHLFMAVPVGVAMMLGQILNTFGPVQTYEHITVDAVGRYRPAVLINPSA